MSTLTRKQRELRERQQLILETARPMLISDGYHGLSMDRIAESLEYSKGTIYNHFSCKEEIIIALAIETLEKRSELFERASAFPAKPRERIAAIGAAAELFVRLYPDHFSVEQTIRADSIWDKTSEKRRAVMRSCEARCTGIVGGIVRDAISQGDLVLPKDSSPEDLVFGLWSMTYGAYSIISTSDSLVDLGIRQPMQSVRENQTMLLDGYRWKPLSSEHDYESVFARIEQELFTREYQSAN